MSETRILFENVSRFYGEVLGVNRITLAIPPGITSLVGPNGSGKTTLMNLMTGLVRPTRGHISVLGINPSQPDLLFRKVGYSTQFDAFPRGLTGYQFIYSFLRLLLPAGLETTFRSSGNLLYLLLTHPDQFAAVQAMPLPVDNGQ